MFKRDRNTLFFIILGFTSMFILISTGQIHTILSYTLLGITLGSFVLALITTNMTDFGKKSKKDEDKK